MAGGGAASAVTSALSFGVDCACAAAGSARHETAAATKRDFIMHPFERLFVG
jgi:hypothetical protein